MLSRARGDECRIGGPVFVAPPGIQPKTRHVGELAAIRSEQRCVGDRGHLPQQLAQFESLLLLARRKHVDQRQRRPGNVPLDLLDESLDLQRCTACLFLLQLSEYLTVFPIGEIHAERLLAISATLTSVAKYATYLTSRPRRQPHSTIQSARTRSSRGMVMPRALAVFRLIARSNAIGCSTGKSAGLAPRRILST